MKKRIMKRGMSPVIAVALLLMITAIAAGIIVAFVVPFVQNNLDRGGKCFEVSNKIIFEPTEFNCYVDLTGDTLDRTGFSVRIDHQNIIGFRVGLREVGSSKTIVMDGAANADVRMLNSDFNLMLDIPSEGEVQTYVAKGKYGRIELAPILASGEKCEIAEDIKLKGCTDLGAVGNITQY